MTSPEFPMAEHTPALAPNVAEAGHDVPEGVRRARAAFLREFAALMAGGKTRGRYVVYHRDRRVAVARDYRSALAEADRLGLSDGEHLVIEVSAASEAHERAADGEAELP